VFDYVDLVFFSASKTEKFLKGKVWNEETLNGVYEEMKKELTLNPNAPGGMVEYRKALTRIFFFQYFIWVSRELGGEVKKQDLSAIEREVRPVSRGEQSFQKKEYSNPVLLSLLINSSQGESSRWTSYPSRSCYKTSLRRGDLH